jgi:RNA recognition motif-containing protein
MTSIFVAKLDFGVTGEQLKQTFQTYGTVIKANVAIDKETGKSRGFGFVEMANREEALKAIEALDGHIINGRPIAVKEAEQRNENKSRDSHSPKTDFRNKGNEFSKKDAHHSSSKENRPNDFKESVPSRNNDDFSPGAITPPIDLLKTDIRKKKDDKKSTKEWDVDRGTKKPKMNAYKKSGKNNKFFGDNDDDWDGDDDLLNYKSHDDDDDFDDLEDDNDI